MTGIISAILVGILRSIAWQSLVVKVTEDMAYLLAKKSGVDAVKLVANRVGDALKDVEQKGN